jgi:hypothetical protein
MDAPNADPVVPAGRRSHVGFVAALVVVHLLLLALMLSRKLDPLFNDAMHRWGPGTDFESYWRAGGAAVLGKDDMYAGGGAFGYRYHPLFAFVVGLGLANRAMAFAYGVWVVVLEVAYFAFWRGLRRALPDRDFRIASVLLVFFTPYYLDAYMGQASFLVGAAMFAAMSFEVRGRPVASTLVLAASIVVKPIAATLLPWLALRGRLGRAALAAALVVAAAVPFFLGPHSIQNFLRVNLSTLPPWWVHAGNQGLHCLIVDLCARLSGLLPWEMTSLADLPRGAWTLVAAWPFALTGLALYAAWTARADAWLSGCLLTVVFLLGYKDVWEHTYSFAAVPLLCACLSGAVNRRALLFAAVWTALPTAFVLYDRPTGDIDPESAWGLTESVIHHATKPVGVTVLFVAALAAAFRRPQETS